MDLSILKEFENDLRGSIPNFSVKWKNENAVQKILGLLLFFNPQYMTGYITTFYPSVYFPSKADYENNPNNSMIILSHERVHLMDSIRYGMWFKFSYLLPQVLFLPFALASILSILAGLELLSVILASLGLVALIPWPSPWRSHWEKRGYAMTLAVSYWQTGSISDAMRRSVKSHFLNWSYYKMSWSPSDIDNWMQGIISSIEDGTICAEGPYYEVHRFLSHRGLVRQ